MKIIVDSREPELFEHLSQYVQRETNSVVVHVSRRQLQIGDVMIVNDDESMTYLVIERKTMDDLSASLSDGRWSEQKKRALSLYSPQQLLYIIQTKNESEIFQYKNRYSRVDCESLLSATMNLILNYHIPYIYLQNMNNIGRYIYRFAIQCHKKEQVYKTTKGKEYDEAYLGSIRSQKQKNMTSNTFFIYCLQGVPGISYKTAKNISELFHHCFSSFFDTIRDDIEQQIVPSLYKQKYGRHLNKSVIHSLYHLFLTDPDLSNIKGTDSSIPLSTPPSSHESESISLSSS